MIYLTPRRQIEDELKSWPRIGQRLEELYAEPPETYGIPTKASICCSYLLKAAASRPKEDK